MISTILNVARAAASRSAPMNPASVARATFSSSSAFLYKSAPVTPRALAALAPSPFAPSSLSSIKPPTKAKTNFLLSFSTRGFSATARASTSSSNSSRSLLDVLDTEIKYEADHVPEGPPALPEGWAFGPSPSKSANVDGADDGSKATGSARLTLVSLRAPAGEKVTIDLIVDDQDEEDDDEYVDDDEFGGDEGTDDGGRGRGDGGGDSSVVFTVTVSKSSISSPSLVFDCRSDGSYLQVIHVSLENQGGGESDDVDDDDDVASYSGPMFDELDEALQAEFESYLEKRGVAPSLGGALAALAEDKEAKEYAAWLRRVRDFVAA